LEILVVKMSKIDITPSQTKNFKGEDGIDISMVSCKPSSMTLIPGIALMAVDNLPLLDRVRLVERCVDRCVDNLPVLLDAGLRVLICLFYSTAVLRGVEAAGLRVLVWRIQGVPGYP
jgi:hypothetical protein